MTVEGLRRSLLSAFVVLSLATAATVGWAMARDDGRGERVTSSVEGPRINDHWHAAITISICAERLPNIPTFASPEGVHTHGDGIIHIHPFVPAGEGAGATLGRFFQYGGGSLIASELRIPGDTQVRVSERLVCDGEPAILHVTRADSGIHPLGSGFSEAIQTCDALPEAEFEDIGADYIPQDGDCIRIAFAP